jgi:hypothetical protein
MYTGEMATPFTKLCSRTLRDQISEKIREATSQALSLLVNGSWNECPVDTSLGWLACQ